MMKLSQVRSGIAYQVLSIALPQDHQRHLAHLGIKKGSQVKVMSQTKQNAILMIKTSRLAFDKSLLDAIEVSEVDEGGQTLPLSELAIMEVAIVEAIYASKETKRRLMDMGLTRGTRFQLRKRAPLGDPLEISLRGYELSLRQSEAQLIAVRQLEDEDMS
ncbi:ferrous iron transport protein A [Streptococcus dysgalactiae subsp. equisimilis]|nr:ferrous iron transport protein A [Streptococcus dysgalactiae]MCL6221114.1 ferrous iron transport protein A [Streptococcus dysgalactiae subsp. equisimilis]MDY2963925.1 ferrous iron transport protein A [Streptococcus dysgalactiae]MDY4034513.1 ferrous iron transport protein A [Streptococcus dysgalactiae]UMY67575.1 ferrous iron transport protein A [Streptococcus dysgalactiae subsp. equisimilis]VEF06180.1 ferrous ion transport protein A [Streptococcus dysgalactiae subsp. equisimilis]